MYRKIRWVCLTRADLVDKTMLVSMRHAGCVRVEFGIESGTPAGMQFLKKGIAPEQVLDAFRWSRLAGLSTMGFVMVNIPGETVSSAQSTFKLAMKANPDFLQVSIMTPYPGTALYSQAEEEGWFITKNWSKFSFLRTVVMKSPTMTPDEALSLQQSFLRRFYLRPATILKLSRLVFNGTTQLKPLARTVARGLWESLEI